MTEFPCECEHRFVDHEWNPDSAFFGFCTVKECDQYSITTQQYCPCQKYQADNLRYLESLVDKHGR